MGPDAIEDATVSGVAVPAAIDEFECDLRGEIEVKGKGAMTTWFVVGRSN